MPSPQTHTVLNDSFSKPDQVLVATDLLRVDAPQAMAEDGSGASGPLSKPAGPAITSASSPSVAEAIPGPKEGIRHRGEQPPRAVALDANDDAQDIELLPITIGTTNGAQGASPVVDPERGSTASQGPSAQAYTESGQILAAPDPALAAVHKRKSLVHFAALCGCLFVNGWNDATTGPMLPRVQEKYGVSHHGVLSVGSPGNWLTPDSPARIRCRLPHIRVWGGRERLCLPGSQRVLSVLGLCRAFLAERL